MEKAYKLVKENGYSPLKACKVANVRIENYNKYVEELNKPKVEVKVEPKKEIKEKTNKNKKNKKNK